MCDIILEQTIARVQLMEQYMDEIANALCSDAATKPRKDVISSNPSLQSKLQALCKYYEGGQWLKDYEADEKGLLPADLKRGVLSEDALYDLLSEIEPPSLLPE